MTSLTQSLSIRQEMSLNLAQCIETTQLLVFHPAVINRVLDSLKKNPEEAERFLATKTEHLGWGTAKSVFGYLHETASSGKGGFIGSPNLSKLEGLICGDATIEPDVVFKPASELFEMPQIYFSQNLLQLNKKELALEQQAIPPNFKNAQRLYQRLLRFISWANDVAVRGYGTLANKQREFLNTLDPMRRQVYSLEDFAEDLLLHPSTVYRLFNGRFVGVQINSVENKIIPAKRILSTRQERETCVNLIRLNSYFEEEAKSKDCLPDSEIAEKISCSRRAISKYRQLHKIPIHQKRAEAYRTNPCFKYEITIE